MDRREFLEIAGAGVAAAGLTRMAQAQAPGATPLKHEAPWGMAAPCGLYCGACPEYVDGKCPGICGCSCGQCEGGKFAKDCPTYQCVRKRGLQSCADCPELPCTRLIMSANDPVHVCGAHLIENLRRRKKLGTAAWLKEQQEYWSDQKKRDRWVKLVREDWGKKP